jgi:hypothetical protein
MSRPYPSLSIRQIVDNVSVAFVYDLARALALVTFVRHDVRRQAGRPADA